MATYVEHCYDSLVSALGYLQTIRIAEIRQAVELVGVVHFDVVVALGIFVLMQFTKFTAVLLLAFAIATCIFYMWETWFPELGNTARQQRMYISPSINSFRLTLTNNNNNNSIISNRYFNSNHYINSNHYNNSNDDNILDELTSKPIFKNQQTSALLPPFTNSHINNTMSTPSWPLESRNGSYRNEGDIRESRPTQHDQLMSQLRQQQKMYAAELAAAKAQYQSRQSSNPAAGGYSVQRQSNNNVNKQQRHADRQPGSSNNSKQLRSSTQKSLQASKRTNNLNIDDQKAMRMRHKNSSRRTSKKHYNEGLEKYMNDPGGNVRADFLYHELLRARLRHNAQSDSYAGPSGGRQTSRIANQTDRFVNNRAVNAMNDLLKAPTRKEYQRNRPKPTEQKKNQVKNQIQNDSDSENEHEIKTTTIK